MKHVLIVSASFLVLCAAAKGGDPDLARLKANYQAATERALAPIKSAYEKELRKLLEAQTKAGKLAAAVETNGELEALIGKQDNAAPAAADPKSLERHFVNKTWLGTGGSSFTFEKNGAGMRQYQEKKSAFIWHETEGGLVETTGEVPGLGKAQTLYFRFVSGVEGYFGESSDAVKTRLTLKKTGL